MMWYVTVEPYHVSVQRIRVRDQGWTEWSRQCYTGPAFGKVSISPTSRGHLTLAMASHSSPHGVVIHGYLVYPWAYK